MTIRAIFFDLGGVILRTEYQAPRERLAQHLNLTYEELVRLVFESRSSRQASMGVISADQHWEEVVRTLHLPAGKKDTVSKEFFDGDFLDIELIDFIRSLRLKYKTGLISNAWGDMREYIVRQGFDDAFDAMTISAEVGILKPDARIYQMALECLGVSAAEAIFVDDMAANIEGAEAVGMRGILFKRPDKAVEELKQLLNQK